MSASTRENAAADAPIARPSDTIAAEETAASLRSSRCPKRTSRQSESSHRHQLHVAARLAELQPVTELPRGLFECSLTREPTSLELLGSSLDVKSLLVVQILIQPIRTEHIGES